MDWTDNEGFKFYKAPVLGTRKQYWSYCVSKDGYYSNSGSNNKKLTKKEEEAEFCFLKKDLCKRLENTHVMDANYGCGDYECIAKQDEVIVLLQTIRLKILEAGGEAWLEKKLLGAISILEKNAHAEKD